MADIFEIAGRIHSTSQEGVATVANEILDETQNKKQSEVNADVARHENEIHGTGGIDSRLSDVEQLAEISIGGGDAQIATGADFTNPDATKRAKVPTVGAIVDGLNDGIYDVSKRNPTAGPNSDGKFTLDYILSNADTLIPTSWRHGGMTISFVDSSDNKYVQYRLMSDTFNTDVTKWQGVDDEPTADSDNLIKSGGVFNSELYIKNNIVPIEGEYWKTDGTIGISQYYRRSAKYKLKDYLLAYESSNIVFLYGQLSTGSDTITSVVFFGSDGTTVVGTLNQIYNSSRGIAHNQIPETAEYIAFNTTIGNTLVLSTLFTTFGDLKKAVNDFNSFKESSTSELLNLYSVSLNKKSNTVTASVGVTYINQIDFKAKSGTKIYIITSGAGNGGTFSVYGDDTDTYLLGYITIGATKAFTLTNDISRIRVKCYNINTSGDITFQVKTENEKAFEHNTEICNNINAIIENATSKEVGSIISNSANGSTSYGYSCTIEHNFKAGQKIKVSVVGNNIVKGKTIAFVCNGFSATQYITSPTHEKEIILSSDATSIRCSMNPDAISASGTIYFNITLCGISTILTNKALSPTICIIDDDTINLSQVSTFRDACVANGIVGTFAALTTFVTSNENLKNALISYEREGFQVVLHSRTQGSFFPYATRDYDACLDDVVHGLQDMRTLPFIDYNYWVTPFGVDDIPMQQLARKVGLKCLVSISQNNTFIGKDGYKNYKLYDLPRAGFNATDSETSTISGLKSLIDDVVRENGLLLIGTHMYQDWTQELIDTRFAELITYAKNAGAKFKTLGEAIREREEYFVYCDSIKNVSI